MTRSRVAACWLACAASWLLPEFVASDAAAERVENLSDRWYAIEVIVFQRTGVTEENSSEYLSRSEARSYPAGVASIAVGQAGAGYRLDPITRATLEFPTLSFHCQAAAAEPFRPPAIPAWYQPAAPIMPSGPAAPGMDTSLTPVGEDSGSDNTVQGLQAAPEADADARPSTEADSRDEHFDASDAQVSPTEAIPAPGAEPPSTAARLNGCIPVRTDADHTASASDAACPLWPLDIALAPDLSEFPCRLPPGNPAPPIKPVLEAHPQLDWLRAVRRFNDQLLAESYRLGAGGTKLARDARRIDNAGSLELLWHGRWKQQVPPRRAPDPLLVHAGPESGLAGTIEITRGQNLHVHARLWYQSRAAQGVSAARPPRSTAVREHLPTGAAAAPPPFIDTYMLLEARRIMRKDKLLYLDHPKLGMLIRADPVPPPDWLLDASAALDSAGLGN